jgi:DNA processing protein
VSPADALLRLALIPGLGPITAHKLLAQAEDPAAIFGWSMDRLQTIDGVGGERARRICDPRGDEAVAIERAACGAAGVRILTRDQPDYPQALTRLGDPPLAVWLTGELQPRDGLAVAVVGPRRPSAYAHRQARRLALGLARLGVTIVSGLARGIDTVAHEAALEADGRTVAVLGSGLGRLYPEENAPLAGRIAAGHGAVLSEFPLATPPSPGTFPRRNRIIAALGLTTLVIEAGNRSGALITARLAMELGREVLVLPGPIDNPECSGSNRLIRDGATLVTGVDDIIDEIEPLATLARGEPKVEGAAPEESMRASSLSGREKQIYLLLDDSPHTIDDLVRVGGFPPSAVSATLLSLELRRLVRKTPGGFVRAT